MTKSIVLFNLEKKKYFSHSQGGLVEFHTDASEYFNESLAETQLVENQKRFKAEGLLTWEVRTLIILN